MTHDVDVATQDKGHRSTIDLAGALGREGFTARPGGAGDEVPPLTHYVRGPLEVELIVPDLPRRRSRGATVSVLGASAQRVPDLAPLLVDPVELEVPGVGRVRVPNPAAYVLQKALTLTDRRSLAKKGKDALYVHDALQLFTSAGRLQPVVVAQAKRVLETLSKGQTKRLLVNVARLGDARSDFVREASLQAAGRPGVHTPEAVALANRLGFVDLFAG